jgi:hypothetical protein
VVLALVCVPVTASAQEKPYLIHAGLGYCKVLNDGAPDGSIGLQAGMIYRIPSSPKVGIGAEIGYLMLGSVSVSESDYYGNYRNVDVKWSAIPVNAEIFYFPQLKGPTPILMAGLGLYPIKVKADASASIGGYSGAASASTTNTDLGINLGGGFLFGESRSTMRFGFDARFHIIMTDVESTNMITAMGRIYF